MYPKCLNISSTFGFISITLDILLWISFHHKNISFLLKYYHPFCPSKVHNNNSNNNKTAYHHQNTGVDDDQLFSSWWTHQRRTDKFIGFTTFANNLPRLHRDISKNHYKLIKCRTFVCISAWKSNRFCIATLANVVCWYEY